MTTPITDRTGSVNFAHMVTDNHLSTLTLSSLTTLTNLNVQVWPSRYTHLRQIPSTMAILSNQTLHSVKQPSSIRTITVVTTTSLNSTFMCPLNILLIMKDMTQKSTSLLSLLMVTVKPSLSSVSYLISLMILNRNHFCLSNTNSLTPQKVLKLTKWEWISRRFLITFLMITLSLLDTKALLQLAAVLKMSIGMQSVAH